MTRKRISKRRTPLVNLAALGYLMNYYWRSCATFSDYFTVSILTILKTGVVWGARVTVVGIVTIFCTWFKIVIITWKIHWVFNSDCWKSHLKIKFLNTCYKIRPPISRKHNLLTHKIWKICNTEQTHHYIPCVEKNLSYRHISYILFTTQIIISYQKRQTQAVIIWHIQYTFHTVCHLSTDQQTSRN